jgi:hypothetical protein
MLPIDGKIYKVRIFLHDNLIPNCHAEAELLNARNAKKIRFLEELCTDYKIAHPVSNLLSFIIL